MPKVLVVEDNVLLADLVEDYLIYGGHEVCGIAGSVSKAVMMADQYRPDIAILDYRLGDGALGSHIRPLLADKTSMKILYVSADDLQDVLTHKDGDAYLRKPYSIDDLLASVRIVCALNVNVPCLPTLFPRNFYLLKSEMPRQWRAA